MSKDGAVAASASVQTSPVRDQPPATATLACSPQRLDPFGNPLLNLSGPPLSAEERSKKKRKKKKKKRKQQSEPHADVEVIDLDADENMDEDD